MSVEDYDNTEVVPCSSEDEFKYIDVIPATQLSISPEPEDINEKTGDVSLSMVTTDENKRGLPENANLINRMTWAGTKRKRVESIRSVEDEPTTPKLDLGKLSLESPNNKMKTPTQKRLKAVPRNAPRTIKTVGIYSIRKGIRNRDFKVIKRVTKPFLSPSSGAEFQCRDGFFGSEDSLGYPQPMKKQETTQTTETSSWERSPFVPRSAQLPMSFSTASSPGSISPYLAGTPEGEYQEIDADPSTLVASEDSQRDNVNRSP